MGVPRSLTIFVEKILQPIELATEAFANLGRAHKEGNGGLRLGTPPCLAPGTPPQGGVLTLLSCHVQSSKSALEQYMGRWPMVMIHGRAARFLLAF